MRAKIGERVGAIRNADGKRISDAVEKSRAALAKAGVK